MASGKPTFRIPRRPLTSASDPPPPAYSDLFPEPPPPPPPPPLPPRLRASKSLAQLPVQLQHSIPPSPPPFLPQVSPATTLPANFHLSPTTTTTTTTTAASAAAPLRRAKSSVDLGRPQTTTSSSSSWKTTLDEARHLAGGLLASPVESTRHHSIIRHSPALLWYRGPSTAALLTVLSAGPLPAARTLHLQRRGLSGNLGMALKSKAGGSSWLDVTPERRGTPADLSELQERGVQRDLRRFVAAKVTGKHGHAPRETLAVRIPAAAEDGYWRVVLCGEGGKVLVGSPVFRLASTATDNVGVLRGAGLRTAPLEVGAMVAAAAARTYVAAASGAAAGAAKMGASKVVASTAARTLAKSVVGDAVKASWTEGARRDRRGVLSAAAMRPTVGLLPGDEDGGGPVAPFPLRVEGTVVRGTGYTRARHGFPTANLAEAAVSTGALTGYFAAWAAVEEEEDSGTGDWCEAVVRVGPAENAPASVAVRSGVAVHVLRKLEEEALEGRRLRVVLMGFLRGLGEGEGGQEHGQGHADDVLTTLASLGREGWRMEEGGGGGWSLEGLAGMLAERMDAVPVHRAGIRSEAGALRDVSFGRGGFWIPR